MCLTYSVHQVTLGQGQCAWGHVFRDAYSSPLQIFRAFRFRYQIQISDAIASIYLLVVAGCLIDWLEVSGKIHLQGGCLAPIHSQLDYWH